MGRRSTGRERTPLEALAIARREREASEARERAAVRAARESGASWSAIGEVYGLTKQGAQQRFKPDIAKSE